MLYPKVEKEKLSIERTDEDAAAPLMALHHQKKMMLGRGCQMIVGGGRLFSHIEPDRYMWAGGGDRQVEVFIPFTSELARKPMVNISLSGIDASNAAFLRFELEVGTISPQGFSAIFKTWQDTRIVSASANWIAIAQSVEARVDELVGDNLEMPGTLDGSP